MGDIVGSLPEVLKILLVLFLGALASAVFFIRRDMKIARKGKPRPVPEKLTATMLKKIEMASSVDAVELEKTFYFYCRKYFFFKAHEVLHNLDTIKVYGGYLSTFKALSGGVTTTEMGTALFDSTVMYIVSHIPASFYKLMLFMGYRDDVLIEMATLATFAFSDEIVLEVSAHTRERGDEPTPEDRENVRRILMPIVERAFIEYQYANRGSYVSVPQGSSVDK